VLLILGGTAAYFLPLEELLGPLRRVELETPHGPAFPIFLLERYGERVAFASRHGLGRLEVSPPFVNARANIWAAHALGVRRIISWNGVGAINPLLEVHDMLALDGLLDFTKTRARSFDDHRPPTTDHQISTIDSCFDPDLSRILYGAASQHSAAPPPSPIPHLPSPIHHPPPESFHAASMPAPRGHAWRQRPRFAAFIAPAPMWWA
jgi:5'-methylthioadenosine phosphorylase